LLDSLLQEFSDISSDLKQSKGEDET